MAAPRKGRQTPSKSVILPYSETHGQEAIDLYNSSGRTALEWQEIQIYDIMAVNDEGLWVHTKYGYSVSRRNGKNEVVVEHFYYRLCTFLWMSIYYFYSFSVLFSNRGSQNL